MHDNDARYLVVILNHGRGHRYARRVPGEDITVVDTTYAATIFTEQKARETAAAINCSNPCVVRDAAEYLMEVRLRQQEVARLKAQLPTRYEPLELMALAPDEVDALELV